VSDDLDSNPVVAEALAAKYRAEAEKELELARYQRAAADSSEFHLQRTKREHEFMLASNLENRVYRFSGRVDDESVMMAQEHLTRWARLSPDPINIILNSPGGSLIDGMELFDTITALRGDGIHFTITARGYAASMGSILLQAADVRVMGKEAYLLVHELSAGASGSIGDIEDALKWYEMASARILNVYADRCAAAANATKPFTKQQIKSSWRRKDWWLGSDECLAGGLVDEVR